MPPQRAIALGTVCSINLFEDGSQELYDKIFFRLQQIDDLFSTTNPNSQVSKINANSGVQPVEVTDEVAYLLEQSLFFAKESNGAFEPTIGPLVNLWQISKQSLAQNPLIPETKELESAKSLVNYELVQLDEQKKPATVYLLKKGMALDFGGIAKGYAADQVIEIVKKAGVKRAVIDLGGNVCVIGQKKNNEKWRIGIRDPFAPKQEPVLQLETEETCVVTSGVYERFFFKAGKRYHHIIDPATMFPAQSRLVSATIIAQNSMICDALSTIAFLKGKDAIDFLKNLPLDLHCSAILIGEDKKILASKDLETNLSLLKKDFCCIEYF